MLYRKLLSSGTSNSLNEPANKSEQARYQASDQSSYVSADFALPSLVSPGPGAKSLPKEATFRFEFYYMLNAVIEGNMYPAPEYEKKDGKDSGCMNIMIPDVEWGIELIYAGRRLDSHMGRFEPAVSYGKWKETGDIRRRPRIKNKSPRYTTHPSHSCKIHFYK